MAYKSIKKGKGKRKGGKKSYRTYKQNGGNKMLLMIIAMLVALGLIFPVSAKLFTNSEEQSNRIVNAVKNEYTDAITQANAYNIGLKASTFISPPGSFVGQMTRKSNLNQDVNRILQLMGQIYGDNFLVITESGLFDLISEKLGEDSFTTAIQGFTEGTVIKIPEKERTVFDIISGNKGMDLSVAVDSRPQTVPGAGETVYIVSRETVNAMARKGIKGEINNLLKELFKDGSTIEDEYEYRKTNKNGPTIE